MNIVIKDRIRDISTVVTSFTIDFKSTIASILRVLLLSSLKTSSRSKAYTNYQNRRRAIVLANGPSLVESFENEKIQYDDADIFCVNNFYKSVYFHKVKPNYYCIVDGVYFNQINENCRKIGAELVKGLKDVNWDMFLVLPSYVPKSVASIYCSSPYITPLFVNTTSIEGFRFFRHWAYKQQLGMPTCMNVSTLAIMTALNIGHKDIRIFGLDHSWLKCYFVDEDNVFCSKEEHVYQEECKITKFPGTTLVKNLDDFVKALRVHFIIDEYANSIGAKIYNCTKGSYVEAYERINTKD